MWLLKIIGLTFWSKQNFVREFSKCYSPLSVVSLVLNWRYRLHWGKMNFEEPNVFIVRRFELPLSGMYRLVLTLRAPSCWKNSGLG